MKITRILLLAVLLALFTLSAALAEFDAVPADRIQFETPDGLEANVSVSDGLLRIAVDTERTDWEKLLNTSYDADMKKPIHAYAFSPGYVENISVSDFNATESSVIIDTIEILYDFAIEIDLTGRTTPVMYAQMMAAEAEEAAYSLDRQNRTVSEIARHNAEVRMNKRKKTAPHDESVTDSIEY